MGSSLDLAPSRQSFCFLHITAFSRPVQSATFFCWSGHCFTCQGAMMGMTWSSAGWEGMTLCAGWRTCGLLSTQYNNISRQLPDRSRKQVTRGTNCTKAKELSCILSQKYHLFSTWSLWGPGSPLRCGGAGGVGLGTFTCSTPTTEKVPKGLTV